MTQRQNNTLTMLNGVVQFMNDNSIAWSANSVVNVGAKTFSGSVAAIITKAQQQQDSSTVGYTEQKDSDYENMLSLGFVMGIRVHNYAVAVNNFPMAQAVYYPAMHDFEKGAEQEVVKRCTTVAEQATAALAAAPPPNPDYKITADGVTALQTAIGLITPDIAERDVQHGVHTGTTASLASLFSTAHTNLISLDRLIEGLAGEGVDDFIANYKIMRRTTDLHARGKDKTPPAPPPVKVG